MFEFLEIAAVAVGARVVLIALAALVAFVLVRSVVGVAVRHLLEHRSVEAGTSPLVAPDLERRVRTIGRLLVRIAASVIVILAVLMSFAQIGIDIGPAVAGLGVVGIAVGFGAQALIRDWLGGVFVVLENQYSQGDVVRIAGVEGKVEDFSLRRTTLRDLSGTVHSVPHGQILATFNRGGIQIPFPHRVVVNRSEGAEAGTAAPADD